MKFVEKPGWQGEFKKLAEQYRARIVEDIADDARRMAAIDTGEMRASIRTDHPGRVYVGTDHWHFVEYDTRAHEIRPRVKQALAWPGMVGGPYAKVDHPGTSEQPFMRPALYRKR